MKYLIDTDNLSWDAESELKHILNVPVLPGYLIIESIEELPSV